MENSDTLTNPILHPCSGEWKIRWRVDRTVVEESKAKKFLGGDLHAADFLMIDNLPSHKRKGSDE
jgi:hypothetical protein